MTGRDWLARAIVWPLTIREQPAAPSVVRPPRAVRDPKFARAATSGGAPVAETILSRQPLRRRIASAWRIVRRRPAR